MVLPFCVTKLVTIIRCIANIDFEFTVVRVTLFTTNFNHFKIKLFVKSKNSLSTLQKSPRKGQTIFIIILQLR
ncbi:hypothetical protein A8L34_02405 [Bacillus sp. FJAT-27264]|nr:hypothetical protein A8L34_02405 [Bacillus sp. FJAT-27264]